MVLAANYPLLEVVLTVFVPILGALRTLAIFAVEIVIIYGLAAYGGRARA